MKSKRRHVSLDEKPKPVVLLCVYGNVVLYVL